MDANRRQQLAHLLALNRTVAIVLVTVLFFGLGEELWSKFMSVYLDAQVKQRAQEAVEAGQVAAVALWTVGIYACLRNLFEGFCYIGGGQVTARLGDRGSLTLFACLTITGYTVFLTIPGAGAAILAALFILGWEPLSVPVTFTTVGSTVAAGKRGMAFALQSIQKRLPMVIGPAIAGYVLAWSERLAGPEEGTTLGMHWLVSISLALGLVSLVIQLKWMPKRKAVVLAVTLPQIYTRFPPVLRRLLLAEVFTRWCDWLIREFVVLYVLFVRHVEIEHVGLLIAAQNLTALATYLPIGRLTQTVGLQPFIGVTFIFFALFPLMLAVVPSDWIIVAFIVYGLREIGEPARKAMITSLLPEEIRAVGVGLYWGLRCFAVCWASLAGAAIWQFWGPEALLFTAFGLGCMGAGVYYLLCRATLNESSKG